MNRICLHCLVMLSSIFRGFAKVNALTQGEGSLTKKCCLDSRLLNAKHNPVAKDTILACGAEVASFQEIPESSEIHFKSFTILLVSAMELEPFVGFIYLSCGISVKVFNDLLNCALVIGCVKRKSIVHPKSIITKRMQQQGDLVAIWLLTEISQSSV